MFVKDFEKAVSLIAKEVACDGGTSIASHKIRSSVSVVVDGDDDEDAEYELMAVEPSMLMGCGCWDGVILRVRRRYERSEGDEAVR